MWGVGGWGWVMFSNSLSAHMLSCRGWGAWVDGGGGPVVMISPEDSLCPLAEPQGGEKQGQACRKSYRAGGGGRKGTPLSSVPGHSLPRNAQRQGWKMAGEQ